MSATDVKICNSALVKIGVDRIVSLDDVDSRPAKLLKNQYPIIRDALIRAHPWNFAIKRVALASAGTPAFGFAYQYALPSDYSRALDVNGNDNGFEWQKEGNIILSDDSTCELRYIAKVAEGYFDDCFSEVLAIKIAHDISSDLTDITAEKKKLLYDEYKDLLREARTFDAQEGSGQRVRATYFLNARRSRSTPF